MIPLQQLASPSFHCLFPPFLRIFQLNTVSIRRKSAKLTKKLSKNLIMELLQ